MLESAGRSETVTLNFCIILGWGCGMESFFWQLLECAELAWDLVAQSWAMEHIMIATTKCHIIYYWKCSIQSNASINDRSLWEQKEHSICASGVVFLFLEATSIHQMSFSSWKHQCGSNLVPLSQKFLKRSVVMLQSRKFCSLRTKLIGTAMLMLGIEEIFPTYWGHNGSPKVLGSLSPLQPALLQNTLRLQRTTPADCMFASTVFSYDLAIKLFQMDLFCAVLVAPISPYSQKSCQNGFRSSWCLEPIDQAAGSTQMKNR